MKKIQVVIALMFPIMVNCQKESSKNKEFDKELISKNDYAARLFSINRDNKDSVKKALIIINEVLEKDSTYKVGYSNKLEMLLALGERNQALEVANKIIQKGNDSMTIYEIKGHILEKLGRLDEAKKQYQIAEKQCEHLIENNPKNINLRLTLIQFHLFTKPLETVKKEYEVLKRENPSNQLVILFEQAVNEFDRQKAFEIY